MVITNQETLADRQKIKRNDSDPTTEYIIISQRKTSRKENKGSNLN